MSGLFGGKPKAIESAPMPDPDDKTSEERRRQMAAEYSARKGGRAASAMSTTYSASKLGSTG